jgi:hypothetical protein
MAENSEINNIIRLDSWPSARLNPNRPLEILAAKEGAHEDDLRG